MIVRFSIIALIIILYFIVLIIILYYIVFKEELWKLRYNTIDRFGEIVFTDILCWAEYSRSHYIFSVQFVFINNLIFYKITVRTLVVLQSNVIHCSNLIYSNNYIIFEIQFSSQNKV